ncbi:hypothetical protein ENSA5_11100 [Enhygromyxa salina]|uniref:Phage-related baseplate assembly protein n=1 Tax=Enhygromyxa salina TaxID=215803 RepID=A0A2S9YG77_9BACT|nr:type VI secretion system tip protein VgrG [Enhygromyxa salina]PRQ04062.1 hypothetical protein ENSA5_11100 [Enhygromyxa salina]
MQIDPRIHDLGEALTVDRPLPRVEYDFVCEAVPDMPWRVRRIELNEGLSRPYELTVDLLADAVSLDPDVLMASNCELTIDRDGVMRSVCGVILAIELREHVEGQRSVRVVVVPALRLLEQRVDTRLWQQMSALAIVEEILSAPFVDYGRELETCGLRERYESREYVVQYQESDLSFVSRLLEDEGISYHFDHDRGTGREVMVLEDSAERWPEVATLDDEPTLAIIATGEHEAAVESIQRLTWAGSLRPTTVVRRTFDWLSPSTPTTARRGEPGGGLSAREVYHHGRIVETDPEPRVNRELAHARRGDRSMRGVANVTGLAPGRRFRVVADGRPELDHEFLVIQQHARGDCPDVERGEIGGALAVEVVRKSAYDGVLKSLILDASLKMPYGLFSYSVADGKGTILWWGEFDGVPCAIETKGLRGVTTNALKEAFYQPEVDEMLTDNPNYATAGEATAT